jgi:transglutaminase-like putative cysteine protease
MRRYLLPALILCLILAKAHAEEPKQQKTVREYWDAAYLDRVKVGSFHTLVREIEGDSGKFLRATVEMDLGIRRGKTTVQMRILSGTDETSEGKVTRVSMIQPIGQGKNREILGKVVEKQLHIKVNDPPLEKKVPWNDEVIGLARQESLFQDRKVKPGDSFRYFSFEPTITSVVGVTATVKDEEEVEVLKVGKDGKVHFQKEKLLRAETAPDKVKIGATVLTLPAMTVWMDKERNIVRSQTELDGIGVLTLHRTTKEVANMENGIPPDILRLIPLNRSIAQPHDTRSAIYRVTLREDDDPKSAFADDSHQSIKNVKGNTFEVHVHPVRAPRTVDKPGKVGEEFLQSGAFLDCNDERIKKNTQEAISNEKDPWKKAIRIEDWVHQHMTGKNDVGTFIASQIAANPEGDCRQYAMLTAAMCRAAEIPSRTAVGLVYTVDAQQRPGMGFHMWTEVWIQGQWVPIDATLGKGHIGAAHIKIADSSWKDANSLTALAPVTRVFGKISMEVVGVNGSE